MKIGKINRESIAISGFTSILKNYEGMPSELYIAGKLPESRIPAVAIVGSRKPTPYGKEVTRALASELASQGVAIISGLAYGIDAVAHQAALDAGGYTIAIFAQGLHRIYPAEHTALAENIIKQGGALISENERGHEPRRYDFLARNRLVSGLADAVVVPEATERSGTLSTISHALEQNKEIFAVPGPITSLLSVGPNRLLRQGAHVALSARDILDVIYPGWRNEAKNDGSKRKTDATSARHGQKRGKNQVVFPLPDTPAEAELLCLIDSGATNQDMLIEQSTLSAAEAMQVITMMELKDMVIVEGGVVRRRPLL